MLGQMPIIRVFDEKMLEVKGAQLLHGRAHSSIGQEGGRNWLHVGAGRR